MFCAQQISFSDQIKKNEIGGHVACMWERYIKIWWGYLKERDHLEHLGVDGSIKIKKISITGMGSWNGLIWLRVGTDGGLF